MIKLIRSANCFTLTLWLLIVGFIAIGSIGGCNNDSRGSSGWISGEAVNDSGESGDGSYGTILSTSDGGKTWVRQGSKDTLPDSAVSSIVALDANHVWAVAAHTVLSTSDGQNWRQHSVPTTAELVTVYPLSNEILWVVGYEGTVLRSTDGATSWEVFQVPVQDVQLQGVYSVDGQTAWVGGGMITDTETTGIVWKTDDGGKSWTEQYRGGPKLFETIRGVDGETLWAGAGANRIIGTTDGGKTWQLQTEPTTQFADVNGLSVVDRNTVFGAWDFGMYLTTDGKTWTHKEPSPFATFYLGVDAIDDQEVWLVGPIQSGPDLSGVVAHTLDAGQTWEDPPVLPVNPEFLSVSFAK
ncbi:MAG: hypothetical protein IH875_05845 [Candidatus Dadabacteria bacterium]|nr:hypothetical protein [Candidatus Dadabacteria bacterium]